MYHRKQDIFVLLQLMGTRISPLPMRKSPETVVGRDGTGIMPHLGLCCKRRSRPGSTCLCQDPRPLTVSLHAYRQWQLGSKLTFQPDDTGEVKAASPAHARLSRAKTKRLLQRKTSIVPFQSCFNRSFLSSSCPSSFPKATQLSRFLQPRSHPSPRTVPMVGWGQQSFPPSPAIATSAGFVPDARPEGHSLQGCVCFASN